MANSISIDNGLTTCTPQEAIDKVAWDVIVNAMQDQYREVVHFMNAPCDNLAFLEGYLCFAPITIG